MSQTRKFILLFKCVGKNKCNMYITSAIIYGREYMK